ncbi:HEXXH motif-containing putative peptide modification protein [Actinosynnema sp. NPDC023794]
MLSEAFFAEVCEGPVRGEVMHLLRRIENTQRKLLILGFERETRALADVEVLVPDLGEAWDLLLLAEDAAPGVVDEVIMFPTVGLWFRRALETVVDGHIDTPAKRAEIGVVHAVAAAAALRAGLSFDIRVPVTQGVVSLPTVGQYEVAVDLSVDFMPLHHSESGTKVEHVKFRPVRRHRSTASGVVLEVVFEDTDPHRAFADSPAAPDPLSDTEFERWCAQLDAAWEILVGWNRRYAEELSVGLMSLAPLTREGKLVGASSASAFGAIALCEKASADELADALVHELQHSKLNAVLECVSLHGTDEVDYFYAPWRDDPRPLNSVLHGIYAFTSVVEFWRARRGLVSEGRAAKADYAFVLRALQVRMAIEDIASTAQLNHWGQIFLEKLSSRLAACEDDLTEAERTGPVAKLVADHRALWRVRHVMPDGPGIAGLADAYLAGEAKPTGSALDHRIAEEPVPGASDRAPLFKAQALGLATINADAADLACAAGDVEAATAAYRRRLEADPDDEQAWAGLALTLNTARPEVVRALHRELRTRPVDRPDPVLLAGWSAG